jgi:hypothetical protein
MDVQQLQLLAARIRELLQQSKRPIGHNQSLDLIAALPGLRNWPEVKAFPTRVLACQLDESAASRLGFRLGRKFNLQLSPSEILNALDPTSSGKLDPIPEIWPSGPDPGVYLTTSQAAIDALLARYEEATDGAHVYAERAGSHWEGSINLGEGGLWSHGLSRVPSGTLLIVGPIELDQRSWEDAAQHLEMACLKALVSGLRVAVLIDSPTPEDICEDAYSLVMEAQEEGDDCEDALTGLVTEQGELVRRTPFRQSWPSISSLPATASPDAIPAQVLPLLRAALKGRTTGILLFGSYQIQTHFAIDLVVAGLALTDHLGPAARITPRHRSTPAKDWLVPEPIKALPFLPSIQSAYERGYRRLIVDTRYLNQGEVLWNYSLKALFLSGTYGGVTDEILSGALAANGFDHERMLVEQVIAMLGVTSIPGINGPYTVSDLFIGGPVPTDFKKFEDLLQHIYRTRRLKWQDQLKPLLSSGEVSEKDIREGLDRGRGVETFLSLLRESENSKASG